MEKIIIIYKERTEDSSSAGARGNRAPGARGDGHSGSSGANSSNQSVRVDFDSLDYAALTRKLDPLCHAVTLHVKGAPVASTVLSPDMYDASMSCVVALWLEGAEHLDRVMPELAFLGKAHGIYLVTEAVAREYAEITWKIGSQSPGATLFAAMRRKPEHTMDDFAERWLVHSKISLRLHPIVRYHRGLTLRRLAGEERWDAFTEERVMSDDDLRSEVFCPDPKDFEMTYEDMKGFLDMPQDIKCVFLRERILKLPSWLEPKRRLVA